MLSTLQHISKIAQDLSQPHFIPESLKDDSNLQAQITAAFNDLMNCMNVINARAPISSLALDILSLILHEVHYDEIQTSRQPLCRAQLQKPPTLPLQSPLVLSHVSRSWHEATLNLPLLWTTVEIFPSSNLSLIVMFLARSKSCPIFLNIIACWTGSEYDDELSYGIDELCDTLVPHISRCRSILIGIDEYFASLLDALHMHLRNLAAPVLEWLFLLISDDSAKSPHPIFTLGAPMLSYIHLS
jgi:hypothetical protein